MYDDSPEMKAILYSKFIKYDKLNEILGKSYCDSINSKILNVYIDLYQFIASLYRFNDMQEPMNLTSCIANLAIHYRNYFKKFGIYTNIFIVYSPTTNAHNLKFCPSWNSSNIENAALNTYMRDIVNSNLGLMGTMIPYLPDIFFRMGTFEVPVIIADMINKFKARGFNPPNLVISSSQYAYQLPAYIENTTLLVQKRNVEYGDCSYVVAPFSPIVNMYINAIKKESARDKDFILRKDYITAAMVLLGVPKRDLKALISAPLFFKFVRKMEADYEVPTLEGIVSVLSRMQEKAIQNISVSEISNRYKCVDLSYQVGLYDTMPESMETRYLKQLSDEPALNEINNTYFYNNPVSLDML